MTKQVTVDGSVYSVDGSNLAEKRTITALESEFVYDQHTRIQDVLPSGAGYFDVPFANINEADLLVVTCFPESDVRINGTAVVSGASFMAIQGTITNVEINKKSDATISYLVELFALSE